ncbi:MAG: PAS domain S-box protein [bacterium]
METQINNDISFDLIEYSPIGILIFDEHLNIKYLNSNFQRYGVTNRISKQKLINQNIITCGLFNQDTILNNIQKILSNEPFENEVYSNKKADGSLLKISIKGAPIFLNESFRGGVLILDDLIVGKKDLTYGDEEKLITELVKKINSTWLITDFNGKIISASDDLRLDLANNSFLVYDLFSSESKEEIEGIYINLHANSERAVSNLHFNYNRTQVLFSSVFLTFKNYSEVNNLVFILLKDVTNQMLEQKEFEQQFSELNKLKQITSFLADSIINLDDTGTIISISKNTLQFFENKEYLFIGKFIGELFPTFTKEYFEIIYNNLLKNKYWTSQLKVLDSTKTQKIIDSKMLLFDEDTPASIILICTDFTEGYELEKEIKSSEEHFRSIVTNSKEFICTFDLSGNITYVNPHFTEIFKITFNDALLLNIIDLVEKNIIPIENFDFNYIIKNNISSIELPLKKMDGRQIYVSSNFTPVYDLQNNPQYYIGIFSDITIQKKSEKDLLLIKTVFEASKDGIAVESDNTLQIVNESFVNIFGYDSPQEIIGKSPIDFVDKLQRNYFINILENLINNSEETNRFEITGIKKNGDKILCEFSIGNYQIGNEHSIVILVRDITLEKESQQVIQISEERLRSITENINEFIWMAEKQNNKLAVVLYTAAAHKITGYCADEFINNPKLWYKIIHPNDLSYVISKMQRLYKDPIRLADEIEYRIINNVGNIIWIKNKITVVREKDGSITKLFGLVSDITITKKNEEDLKNSTDNLKKLNDTKDRFLSIVSHDLRTPFSSILGFTDILLSDRNLSEEKQVQYISFIQESSNNMLALVNSLLDWTRIQTGRIEFIPERLNAKSIVNKSIQALAGAALPKGISIISTIEKDIHVHADENLLFQVFNNLISNAIKFCKKDDTITISAVRVIDKKQIKFAVKDTGVGIKEENLSKLFKIETKFTLQGTSGEKGSGLGLSLVNDIVQKHGGDIWVESKFGEGTTFIFTCPVSSTNILLVDDVKSDRILYAKLLKSVLPDYNILEASNGKEAFELIKQTYPALVITDHDMPVMNGYDLVKQINQSKLKYKPPIIILSSDLTNSSIDEYKELGIEYIFHKPVNLLTFKMSIEKSLKKAIFN